MLDSLKTNPNRHVTLEGANNVRDLGGYMTKDGYLTKWGKYYRADSIHLLPVESQTILQALGIGALVDLRHPSEGPYQFAETLNMHYKNITLHDPEQIKVEKPKSLTDLYITILDSKQDQVYEVMQYFVKMEEQPVLFHCKAGKDRTGVIAALLLDLVGVSHDIIAEDYALTGEYIQLKDESKHHTISYLNEDQYVAFRQSKPEFMLDFLAYLQEHYDNSEAYLKHIGLQEKELDLLKKHFIA